MAETIVYSRQGLLYRVTHSDVVDGVVMGLKVREVNQDGQMCSAEQYVDAKRFHKEFDRTSLEQAREMQREQSPMLEPRTPALGDVVRLKSGGFNMVVDNIDNEKRAFCYWHGEQGKLYTQWIPSKLLIFATTPFNAIAEQLKQLGGDVAFDKDQAKAALEVLLRR